MYMHRRAFIKASAAGVALGHFPGLLQAASQSSRLSVQGYGDLLSDTRGILDLPRGFKYQVISVQGQLMADGLKVPGWPDGMHAFKLDQDRVAVMCNHELEVSQSSLSAWAGSANSNSQLLEAAYDHYPKAMVAPGGVRRMVYNLKTRRLEKQHMALCGTLRNCSGGAKPWNSWISCEESVVVAGVDGLTLSHGYSFEVPAKSDKLHRAVPLTAMGRFNHEAAGVDPATGIVYMTEDRGDGLLYRFIPKQKNKLSNGGQLQALVLLSSKQSISTGNRGEVNFPVNEPQAVGWVTLRDVESPADDLRYQGQGLGAARFIRGEGLVVETDGKSHQTRVWIMCTSGGKSGLGQIFHYQPSSYEGRFRESQQPGRLTLFSEPNDPELLRNGDNLVLMPNGDLLVCEDHQQIQRLIGVTVSGEYYVVARNPRGASEFTGATFSPDGSTLFVNLQQQGGTVAITGPWGKRLAA
jgi:secreted PhoX family phosphatase